MENPNFRQKQIFALFLFWLFDRFQELRNQAGFLRPPLVSFEGSIVFSSYNSLTGSFVLLFLKCGL